MDKKTYKEVRQFILTSLQEKGVLVREYIVKEVCVKFGLNTPSQSHLVIDVYHSLIGDEAEWTDTRFHDTIRKSSKLIRDSNITNREKMTNFLVSSQGIFLICTIILIIGFFVRYKIGNQDFLSHIKGDYLTIVGIIIAIIGILKK